MKPRTARESRHDRATERERERTASQLKVFSLAVTGRVKANRRERVSKKNNYYRHYREKQEPGQFNNK